ncbi:Putative Transcriptional activator xlnR [[Torrubiella] hemipterigena]|nr:Putative Transcriptional activator xlnR [[Torrubiella] hemipterigena]
MSIPPISEERVGGFRPINNHQSPSSNDSPLLKDASYAPNPPQNRTSAHLNITSLVNASYQSHQPSNQMSPPGALPDGRDRDIGQSEGYPSPAQAFQPSEHGGRREHRPSFHSNASNERIRESLSSSAGRRDTYSQEGYSRNKTDDCQYKFLQPVLPYIRHIISPAVACELLDIFLTDPGSSLFRGASPYILTRIFRKKSILHPTNPRNTTPALLATILWCVAQTADVMVLHVPGTRARIVNELYNVATALVSERDPDRWRRIHGGLSAENDAPHPGQIGSAILPTTSVANEPVGLVDDVLTFILLSIAVSGGDFKSDCYKWWSKAVRLAFSLRLHREDERCTGPVSPCANPLCTCHRDEEPRTIQQVERQEERRRVFWLLYSLDRHLSLSFNTIVTIPDSYLEIYTPLPNAVWENLDSIPSMDFPVRAYGPPTLATGTEFFEYFLPLMAILGDIIEIHHRRRHPRFGGLDDAHSVAVVAKMLADFEYSLEGLSTESAIRGYSSAPVISLNGNGGPIPNSSSFSTDQAKARLVKAYSTHILHVLHVLLHGKWDALSMLDDGDDWITSDHFTKCASHAVMASQSVSTILTIDPELTFMSYLFGIYLLQGSFILLLFADRMPQLGPNESVEQACETIIRAHEVCVVTLSTEFQKNFRKVVRSTLYSVRGAGTTNWEEHRARRRALSLYRWTKGAKGLAL